jgi:peroxiredoxin
MMIGIGDIAPAFHLRDENGREVTLPKTTRPTVIVFYRGDW